MPLRLTDEEMCVVFAAAAPLPIECRGAFLQQVASALGGYREIGPGLVHRICAETQRKLYDPPEFTTGTGGKYHR